jgi:hypothetical protein
MLDDTLATVHQLHYDQVTVHRVPPDEMVFNLVIHQATLWLSPYTLKIHPAISKPVKKGKTHTPILTRGASQSRVASRICTREAMSSKTQKYTLSKRGER